MAASSPASVLGSKQEEEKGQRVSTSWIASSYNEISQKPHPSVSTYILLAKLVARSLIYEGRKCSCLISHIIILNSIKVVTGRKEEVGNGYWVGKPAVSDTTLNITVERVLECGCPWKWRTLETEGWLWIILRSLTGGSAPRTTHFSRINCTWYLFFIILTLTDRRWEDNE